MPTPARPGFRSLELLLGLVVTVLVAGLNFRFYRHAGALWRDEVGSVNLASLPSFAAAWANNNDSFPVLWVTLLHGWIALGFGDSDGALRALGLSIGLGLVGMYWLSARTARVPVPWVLLLLVGMNPTVIVYGSQVRGYGLGMVTELAMLAALFWYVQRPSPRRALLAAGAALLAVQSVYMNSFMLAAAGIAWGFVLLGKRQGRALALLVAVCAAAAVSVLPYLRTYSGRLAWAGLFRGGYGLRYFVDNLLLTMSHYTFDLSKVAPALLLAALVLAFWRAGGPGRAKPAADRSVASWCAGAIVLGLVLHFTYLTFLDVGASYWYNFPVLVLLAFCLELLVDDFVPQGHPGRPVYAGAAFVLAVVFWQGDWGPVARRMTNVDLAADAVARSAAPDDLVVVWPFHLNVVFERYYRGAAPWIALPNVANKRGMEPADFLAKMVQPHAIDEEMGRITSALRAGRRVWFVGGLRLPPAGQPEPPWLPAGPTAADPRQWRYVVYSENWSAHVGYLVQTHCKILREVSFVPAGVEVHATEVYPLWVAEGWQ